MVIRIAACLLAFSLPASAAVTFDAVAAGDMSGTDTILWTRATDAGGATAVTAQVATDAAFRAIVWSGTGTTAAENDFTLKLNPTGLLPGTRYFYRFAADTVSETGRFRTAPAPDRTDPVTFGFSGDADGRFRPYPSVAALPSHDLDFFIFLGDTIYETASGLEPTVSPAVPILAPTSTPEECRAALAVYYRKYLENVSGVSATGAIDASGPRGLASMFAATGMYSLLDNHELGNASLQSGGAPLALLTGRNPATTPAFDANMTGTFHNQTTAFMTMEKAFFDYHPTRAGMAGQLIDAPADPRTNQTPRQFFARQWGSHALYIQVDDRSYRDARLGTGTGSELPAADRRGDNPHRTMLGATQLDWLKQTLRAATTTWKFVVISTPIDMTGNAERGQKQDQKSWHGGYRAERNALLRFIAEQGIDHVVFLTTDDHMTRVTRLQYDSGGGKLELVPGAFQIVAGPIGAAGPDRFTRHDLKTIRDAVTLRTESQAELGQPMDGIAGLPGLLDVRREFDPDADTKRDPVDFLSPDTFGYAVLSIDAAGTLSVSVFGIPSYAANRNFIRSPEPEHLILSFRVRGN